MGDPGWCEEANGGPQILTTNRSACHVRQRFSLWHSFSACPHSIGRAWRTWTAAAATEAARDTALSAMERAARQMRRAARGRAWRKWSAETARCRLLEASAAAEGQLTASSGFLTQP